MKYLLAGLVMLATILAALYILIWWGIVEPIVTVANAIDTESLTAGLVGWEVIKFLLRGVLAWIVAVVGSFLAALIKA